MSEVSTKRPNVVVLFPDQLRALSLPLFGEQQIETPNIDRLAADSLVLENAISNCPVCTPARAMLLTGRYPQTTGHLINTTAPGTQRSPLAMPLAKLGTKPLGWASGICILVCGQRWIACPSTQTGCRRA